jgi:organic hydroperoxide reductase OsmC/OhrA
VAIMQPLPHIYSVTGRAAAAGHVLLSTPGAPALASAAPSQFGGPGDQWSPESLLAAAFSSCFILSFRSVARASKLEWIRMECAVEATLGRIAGVTQFTRVIARVTLTIPESAATALYEPALAKAEHGCLVGNSLRCQRELQVELVREPAMQLLVQAVH